MDLWKSTYSWREHKDDTGRWAEKTRLNQVLGRGEHEYNNTEHWRTTIISTWQWRDLKGIYWNCGNGTKKIRIASLPPEVKENEIRDCMSRFGEVKSIRDEIWTSAYRYKVYNGIRIVEMKLKQHLPSIAGNDAIISYDGQPPTCYRCNETGHEQLECPRRKRLGLNNITQPTPTWADIVSNKTQEQLYNTSAVQKSPNNEIGTKRTSILPEVNSEKNRPPHFQREQMMHLTEWIWSRPMW